MYTPLKVTTDYSILKSLIKIKDLINFCVQKNISSCAICDQNLLGVIEFYKTCQQNNIKPIIGLEITLNNNPLYLYAKGNIGYHHLLKINSIITEREISIYELENLSSDLLVIVPYQSLSLFPSLSFLEDLYLSYENNIELQNALVITTNVVYVNNINIFSKEDNKYLKYLYLLEGANYQEYHHNYFDYENLTTFDLEQITKVVNLLNVQLEEGKRYIPKYINNSFIFLKNLCLKGLKKRLNNHIPDPYIKRLKYELSVINKMGFVDYFLIVYDYVLYAKKNHILVGPGRGSAAGSLVSYVIGITDIDPLKYNLLFERFLNYERVSMPDIDIDFDSIKRDEVINYVKNKYGALNVSGGITFTTLKTRLVLREVGRILKIDERLLDKFLKVINRDLPLLDNLKNKDVNLYLKSYPDLQNLYQISLKLENLKRNISTHAAGIVIGDRPLDEIIPMYKHNDLYLTGVTMDYLEDLGLLKMDFLGLKNLTIISNIIKEIPNFNLNKIPLDDKAVYDLFCTADTDGIFQFETPTFKKMLVKYRPQNFNELSSSIALVRPGPSTELETYIKRKNHQEKITYPHPDLKPLLEETYGVIVYQEQVISILVKMASFTYAEADNIRRAMAKKKKDIISAYQEEFIKRCLKNGYEKALAQNIYDHILKFALYGFNKSHSVSYAIISYQMAYLKVHYRPLFTFTLLENDLGSLERVKKYLASLKQNNFQIHPVNINISQKNFILKNNIVYLPFKLIRNLKTTLITKIIAEREENGLYQDVYDFFRRTNKFTNYNDYLMLIKAGTLSDFAFNTKTLVTNLDEFINYGKLYNDLGSDTLVPNIRKVEDYDIIEKRNNEINSYGFFISNHPASREVSKEVMKLDKIKENTFKNVYLYVMIENIKRIKTQKKEDMAFMVVSDETGEGDLTIFPKNFYIIENLHKNDLIKVWGRVSKRFDKYNILVNRIEKE